MDACSFTALPQEQKDKTTRDAHLRTVSVSASVACGCSRVCYLFSTGVRSIGPESRICFVSFA